MSNSNVTIPPATVVAPVTTEAAPAAVPAATPPQAPPPAVAPPAQAPAAVAPTPPVAPPADTPQGGAPGDPTWLKPRLERERLAGLRAAGFNSEADAKAAADAIKAKADADKTAEQRALEARTQLEAEKARGDGLAATLTEHAARMMIGLSADQQAAVKAIAGDDAPKQVAAIHALTPTWAKQAASTVAPVAPAAPPAAPLASTTAPPAGAPTDAVPPAVNPRAAYEQIQATNPFAAAAFGDANPDVYTPKR